MDAEAFAQKVCSHLEKRIDGLDTKIMRRFDHIERVQVQHGEALATLTAKLTAEKETVEKLEERVDELEKADRKNEFTKGKLIGAAACITAGAAGVGAAIAKALGHH